MKKLWMVLLACTLMLGGAACSPDSQEQAEDTAGDVADEAEDAARDAADAAREGADRAEDVANDETVNIDDNAYEPDELTIERGQEVTWVNQDDVPHTVTASEGDAFGSEQLGEGDEF